MPRRKQDPVVSLVARLAALEERVRRLEVGEAPPGDGRAAARPAPARGKRCPGCGLPMRQRKGRCVACGRPVDSL